MLTSLTRSTLRSIFLVKCHPNAVFFSIPRCSKDHAFQLLEFSIHKPTSSPLKLSSIHNIILPPIQYKKGFFQRRSITSLRTNSVEENFYKYKRDFEQRLCNRGYPTALVHKILTEVQFSDRTETLRNKAKKEKEILSFVTTYTPSTQNLKKILMKHWHIIQLQPRLAHIFN